MTVIIGVLAQIAAPRFHQLLDRARIAQAIGDIDAISLELTLFELVEGTFPNTLADIGRSQKLDPWGNPYEYVPIRGRDINGGGHGGGGRVRKDRFLHPLNTDFDLYSMGPDGRSNAPLTARASRDDIIRANDGGYVGVAEYY